jgi:putative membrane protein
MLYLYVKSLHVIAIISWMAGLLYLPRLFVYHVDAEVGSKQSETFKVMERRLMQAIMTPAMLASWVLGLVLLFVYDVVDIATDGWFHAKLLAVTMLTIYHFFLNNYRKVFAADANHRTTKFFRIINEVPTVIMIVVVIMVVARPF